MTLQERIDDLESQSYVLSLIGEPKLVNSPDAEPDGRKEWHQSYLEVSNDGQSVIDKKVAVIELTDGTAYWKTGMEPKDPTPAS